MKKSIVSLSLISALSAPAMAHDANTYVMMGLTNAKSNLMSNMTPTYTIGYEFNEYVGIEAAYTFEGNDSNVYHEKGNIVPFIPGAIPESKTIGFEQDFWTVTPKLTYDVTDRLSLVGKFGVAVVTTKEITSEFTFKEGGTRSVRKDSDTTFTWGVGAEWVIAENEESQFYTRATYDHIDMGKFHGKELGGLDTVTLSVGLKF